MRSIVRLMAVALVVAALWALMPGPADAQSFTTTRPGGRGGTWDFYLPLSYADTTNISSTGGSSLKINGDFGFGFGFGYNINDHFQVSGLFNWNSRSYEATQVNDLGQTRQYSNYMYTSNFNINGVFYLLPGNVTPFVSGTVGITYVDTNIQNGQASGSCWYDPWWGYVCSSYYPTKTENDFNYGLGVGVRFDVNRQFSLQGSFNRSWIDIGKASGIPDFDVWRLDFIFRM
jgi:hypothetical protein